MALVARHPGDLKREIVRLEAELLARASVGAALSPVVGDAYLGELHGEAECDQPRVCRWCGAAVPGLWHGQIVWEPAADEQVSAEATREALMLDLAAGVVVLPGDFAPMVLAAWCSPAWFAPASVRCVVRAIVLARAREAAVVREPVTPACQACAQGLVDLHRLCGPGARAAAGKAVEVVRTRGVRLAMDAARDQLDAGVGSATVVRGLLEACGVDAASVREAARQWDEAGATVKAMVAA